MSKLSIRVIPNASRTEIVGQEGQTWKIRLAAPPIDGKANEALIQFLADILDLAPTDLRLIKGQSSKNKLVEAPLIREDIDRLLDEANRSN